MKPQTTMFILLALLLAACGAPVQQTSEAPKSGETSEVSPTSQPTATVTLIPTASATPTPAAPAEMTAQHVIDGKYGLASFVENEDGSKSMVDAGGKAIEGVKYFDIGMAVVTFGQVELPPMSIDNLQIKPDGSGWYGMYHRSPEGVWTMAEGVTAAEAAAGKLPERGLIIHVDDPNVVEAAQMINMTNKLLVGGEIPDMEGSQVANSWHMVRTLRNSTDAVVLRTLPVTKDTTVVSADKKPWHILPTEKGIFQVTLKYKDGRVVTALNVPVGANETDGKVVLSLLVSNDEARMKKLKPFLESEDEWLRLHLLLTKGELNGQNTSLVTSAELSSFVARVNREAGIFREMSTEGSADQGWSKDLPRMLTSMQSSFLILFIEG